MSSFTTALRGLVLLLVVAVWCLVSVSAARSIVPGAPWKAVDGSRIEAHAPGVVVDPVDGSYWWFGESAKTANLSDHGVNCYHSTDFFTWTAVGQVINQGAIRVPGRHGPYTIERPKVLWHAGSGSFVMWFHIDDNAYDVRRVGVAVSFDIAGSGFTFVRSFQPDGLPSLDMSVFEDRQNGTVLGAYFVRSVDNAYVGISRLTDDYMDTQGLTSIIPEPREGHALFFYQQRYFMLTSHLTGWAPNDMEAFVSTTHTLQGAEWRSLGNPTGSKTTFDSQPALVMPFTDANGAPYFIYLGDRPAPPHPRPRHPHPNAHPSPLLSLSPLGAVRCSLCRWASPNLLNASYIWLPITIHPNLTLSIPFRDSWDLDHPFNTTHASAAPHTTTIASNSSTQPLDRHALLRQMRTAAAEQQAHE